jgi:hypothetical protein
MAPANGFLLYFKTAFNFISSIFPWKVRTVLSPSYFVLHSNPPSASLSKSFADFESMYLIILVFHVH